MEKQEIVCESSVMSAIGRYLQKTEIQKDVYPILLDALFKIAESANLEQLEILQAVGIKTPPRHAPGVSGI